MSVATSNPNRRPLLLAPTSGGAARHVRMSAASVTGLVDLLCHAGWSNGFPSFPSLCNRSCVTPTEAALRRRQHYRLVVGVRAALLLHGSGRSPWSAYASTTCCRPSSLWSRSPPRQHPAQGRDGAAHAARGRGSCCGRRDLRLRPNRYFLPYLIAPALAAGLAGGAVTAVTAVGMAAAVLLSAGSVLLATPLVICPRRRQWGDHLAADRPARGLGEAHPRRKTQPTDPSYEAAYRLLSQLRAVSRQLSGGLDAISLAQSLLESLQRDRPTTWARCSSGRRAANSSPWRVRCRPGRLGRRQTPRSGTVTVPPSSVARIASMAPRVPRCCCRYRLGGRPPGWWPWSRPTSPRRTSDGCRDGPDAALRLETALLFGEMRSIATVEERRRLAREIHDGIAQELASLGLSDGRSDSPRQA